MIREYAWGLNLGGGIGDLLNIRQDNADYTPLYDGKGNIIAVLDSAGSLVAQYRHSTFGQLEVKTGTLDQPFGFSTKRNDPALGLIYYGYRFYSPEQERWFKRDPLGEAGGINLYAFVGNNPVSWVDPWGESYDDVELMLRAQIALMQDLNKRGIRLDSSSLNGILGTIMDTGACYKEYHGIHTGSVVVIRQICL